MEFDSKGIQWKLKMYSFIYYQNIGKTVPDNTINMTMKKAPLHIYVLRSIYNIVSVCISILNRLAGLHISNNMPITMYYRMINRNHMASELKGCQIFHQYNTMEFFYFYFLTYLTNFVQRFCKKIITNIMRFILDLLSI